MIGRKVGKRMEQKKDGTQPLALSTAGKKGAVDSAKITLVIIFVIGILRGTGHVKWDESQDAEIAGAILLVSSVAGGIIGSLWNLVKHRKLAKNGITLTREKEAGNASG